MDLIYLIIVFVFAITFSNIVNRLVPIVPLPIVQIIFGLLIGLSAMGKDIHFEPEIFLIMIIAPLLFHEGAVVNIGALMKNTSIIMYLAFGGVFITLISVGWVLHLLLPELPLAACFAFGAALGPTDVVAVSSLSEKIQIPDKVMNILSGEGLINDASGVTAFQFAVTALLTGTFSPASASGVLLISSIGGALIGVLSVSIKRQAIKLLEKSSARDVTGYLLLDLLLPFLAYAIAEFFHTSGIIACVTAGVTQAYRFRKTSLFEAELSSVSESTWNTITFILNALVFLFLGIQISQVFSPIWNSETYSNSSLFGIILIIAVTLFAVRFFSIVFIYAIKYKIKNLKAKMNDMVILTFGGVKGAVSLATAFILPTLIDGKVFEERPLLLFITACVILMTLIGGILVLPFLTEGNEAETVNYTEIEMLREVVRNLIQLNKEDPHVEMNAVIENYQDRIKELYTQQLPADRRQDIQELQALIVSIERDGLEESFKQKEIGIDGYRIYEHLITRMERSITKQLLSIIGFWLLFVHHVVAFFIHPSFLFNPENKERRRDIQKEEFENIRTVFLQNTEVILKSLDNLTSVYDDDVIRFFIESRLQLAQKFEEGTFFDSFFIDSESSYIKETLIGYQEERKMIDKYEEKNRISSEEANDYRKNVNLLESFSINDTSNTIPVYKMVQKFNRRS